VFFTCFGTPFWSHLGTGCSGGHKGESILGTGAGIWVTFWTLKVVILGVFDPLSEALPGTGCLRRLGCRPETWLEG